MSSVFSFSHSLVAARKAAGWSQKELAEKAGMPRSTLSAIELGKMVPSVALAISLARTLGRSVESLFSASEQGWEWAWAPQAERARFHAARVGERRLLFPVESLSHQLDLYDGVAHVWADSPTDPLSDAEGQWADRAERTLVIASCDPAMNLLAAEMARVTGIRVLVFQRGGMEALRLLRQGLVHAAGLHFSTDADLGKNQEVAEQELGTGYSLVRCTTWETGLALSTRERHRSTDSVLRSCGRWALRESGSAARECIDSLREGLPHARGRVVPSHAAVAMAVQVGWADAGVCVRISAEEAGIAFRLLRREHLDLCILESRMDDAVVRALLHVLGSRSHRHRLDEVLGYDSTDVGEVLAY